MAERPPTPAMIAVLRKMADGGRLWRDGHFGATLHLGDETEEVHGHTVRGMLTRELIKWDSGRPWSRATLTAKGQEPADD